MKPIHQSHEQPVKTGKQFELLTTSIRPRLANPFRAEQARARSLRPLKRALVVLGGSGRRADFEFVKRAFAEIPELRSA
jgi:hypothetical protein